jgi:hypothetical protein
VHRIVVPYYVVYEVAGDLYVLGVECFLLCKVLYLDYYDTAAVLNSVCYCKAFVYNGFVSEGNVAVLVCDGSSEESNIYFEGRVEEVFLSAELYELDDFVLGFAGCIVLLIVP